ncbi:MAG: DUF3025 domain-containing protein [Dokdonella sp.]|uniref:DUF3025 domain-containing protein n=1 Tax=Dokdonella sp. TaxID=2291710 RepID=UPI0032666D60
MPTVEQFTADSPVGVPSAGHHPLFKAWVDPVGAIDGGQLPGLAALENWRVAAQMQDGLARPAFCAQDAQLLADGLHYETRIAERGVLATRERDPHDFFNALVWLRHPRLKQALNARQVADIACVGPKQRTRGQCALTHFDEAGAIVWIADPKLVRLWDAHDWAGLFGTERAAWGDRIAVTVFGHALVEHVWRGHLLPGAKALAVEVAPACLRDQRPDSSGLLRGWPEMEAQVADAIAAGELLADPQDQRPLPLAGLPGWHPSDTSAQFLRDAPCFRPLRAGRRYPPPMRCG